MPEKLPASITAQRVSGKGIGLFTSKPVDAGALVLSIERPLVRVPDNEHLAQTCYNCFYLLPPEDRSDTVTKTLKTCTGCQVVKYCSQVSGWTQFCILFTSIFYDSISQCAYPLGAGTSDTQFRVKTSVARATPNWVP